MMMQIPPTPTPIPQAFYAASDAAQAAAAIDSLPGLWDFAPEAVSLWNMFPSESDFIAWMLFIFLTLIVVIAIYRTINQFNDSDDV